jgi:hypothetical protein
MEGRSESMLAGRRNRNGRGERERVASESGGEGDRIGGRVVKRLEGAGGEQLEEAETSRTRTHAGDEEEDGEGVDDRDEGDGDGRHDLAERVEVDHEPQDAERPEKAEDAADGAHASTGKQCGRVPRGSREKRCGAGATVANETQGEQCDGHGRTGAVHRGVSSGRGSVQRRDSPCLLVLKQQSCTSNRKSDGGITRELPAGPERDRPAEEGDERQQNDGRVDQVA